MDALYQRVQKALIASQSHEETLFPPLQLLGWWVVGVVLLKQIGALGILWIAAVLLGRLPTASGAGGSRLTRLGAGLVLLLVPVALISALSGLPQAWAAVDVEMTVRLLAAIVALWVAVQWWGRRSSPMPATHPSTGLWLIIAVLVTLAPFLLFGPILVIGLVLLGLLGLARWCGRRAKAAGRPRWQPALVALVSVLPSTIWVLRARDMLAWDTHSREQILVFLSSYQENSGGMENALPLLVLVPLGLVAFFVLCRVAALELPVRSGIARGLRRTVPAAVGLLIAAYLATLVPTVAEDRRADRQIQQTLQDELVAAEGAAPHR
jgi:hypothetical protein